jgi:peptide/nickel transport system permease protein
MATFLARRFVYAVILMFAISVISFVLIQLPPGDFASMYASAVAQRTGLSDDQMAAMTEGLRVRYGLDKGYVTQYWIWIWNIVSKGDFGQSFTWNMPVARLLIERVPITIFIGFISLFFQFVVGIPIGVYTAIRKQTIGDYFFTFLSFVGRSVPEFLFALLFMVILFNHFSLSMGALFSSAYKEAPWSMAKFLDLMKHLIVPVTVVGLSSTADTVRILRAAMLDELQKDYVRVARAKGISEWRLVIKYPFRLALNPIIAALGWQLPVIISGSLIVSIVVNLPTTGPLIYTALLSQDTYLAGAFVLVLSVITILGTLISDILLAVADPRISYREERS